MYSTKYCTDCLVSPVVANADVELSEKSLPDFMFKKFFAQHQSKFCVVLYFINDNRTALYAELG